MVTDVDTWQQLFSNQAKNKQASTKSTNVRITRYRQSWDLLGESEISIDDNISISSQIYMSG